MPTMLKALSQEISPTKKYKAKKLKTVTKRGTTGKRQARKSVVNTKEKESRNSSRIPGGFSIRTHSQISGPRPKCKGCSQEIDYNDACIRNNHKKESNHVFLTVDSYHCEALCLEKLESDQRKLFWKRSGQIKWW